MAITINGYNLNVSGQGQNNDGSDITVGTSANGLICAAAWATDDRLAGIDVQTARFRVPTVRSRRPSRNVDPYIPMITVRDVVANEVGFTNNAIPYGIEDSSELRIQGNMAQVVTLTFPAVLMRVAVFSVQNAGNAKVKAFSVDEDGNNAMAKFAVNSYDLDHTLGANQTLNKVAYRISPTQPEFNVWSTKTEAALDVSENDIVIWAASDTSPNAATASATILNGFGVENLLNDSHSASLTNDGTTFSVSSLARIDRMTQSGRVRARFDDVTGSIQAIRLTPSISVVDESYSSVTDPLAYFEVHVPQDDGLVLHFPEWLTALKRAKEGDGSIGIVGNWPREIMRFDATGVPKLWNTIQIWSLDPDDLTNVNIPFGSVESFADRDEAFSRMELLDKQL